MARRRPSTFLRDERGNFGTMMAIAMVPVVLVGGLAIDLGQSSARRAKLQQAMDAAVLAIAREGEHLPQGEAIAIAHRFIQANFDPDYTNLKVVRDGSKVTIDAQARAPLAFGSLLGMDSVSLAASSSADMAFADYEIALVLDTTGSMAGGKLKAMKDAVTGMVDTMSAQIQSRDKLKFAVVPFANFVNVGPAHGPSYKKNGKIQPGTGADWLDLKGQAEVPQLELVPGLSRFELFHHLKSPWKGCVETREPTKSAAHDVDDTTPTPKDKQSYFVPAFSIDEPDLGYANSYIASNADPFDKSATGKTRKLLKYGVNDVLGPLPLVDGWTEPKTDYSGGKGPNRDCVTQPIMPLNNDYAAIRKMVASLQASGTTNIMEGVAWGMRVLSPEAPFSEGRKPQAGLEKVMIVLTDGSNVMGNNATKFGSSYSSFGFLVDGRLGVSSGSSGQTNQLMNARTLAACDNAKKRGVTIYTIRLEEPDVKTGAMLKQCATSPDHYFDSPSRDRLDEVFKAIRDRVVRLRIAS